MKRYLPVFVLFLTAALLLMGCADEDPQPVPTATPTTAAAVTPAVDAEPTVRPTATFDPATLDNPPDWQPQLVRYTPGPGGRADLSGAITLRFDQPMNPDTVRDAFAIEPAVDGELTWPRPDTLVFTPAGTLERAQTYRVSVDTAASGINGLPLQEPIDLNVDTVGYLDVADITPADGTTDVQADGAITVLFNRPVVPLVSTTDQADLPAPLVIEPAVDGTGTWVSTSIYRFEPTDGFAGGQTYTARVPAGLTDIAGNILEEPTVSTFTTAPPQVVRTQPRPNQGDGLPLDATLRVVFNMPMDTAVTEQAITLDPAGSLAYQWRDGNREVVITPTQQLQIDTDYTLNVAAGATAAGGGRMADGVRVPFRTVPYPAVLSTDPTDGADDAYPGGYVNVRFASPMDWQTIDGRIQIDPAPEEVNYDYSEGTVWLGLRFDMQPRTDYTITIPQTAADVYGNTLREAYTFSFTTGDLNPILSTALPFQVNHFSTSYPTTVNIVHRNIADYEIALYDLGLPVQNVRGYDWQELENTQPLRTWTIEPNTAVNRLGSTELPLNGDEALSPGVYGLTLTTADIDGRVENRMLVVADTNVVIKEMVDGVYVWTTDIATGRPAPRRLLALYNRDREQLDTAETDENGLAFFESPPRYGYLEGVAVISETPGETGFGFANSAWSDTAPVWDFGLDQVDTSQEAPTTAYVYTDRPLYRPGHTVYFKGVVRAQDYGRYSLPDQAEVTVDISGVSYGPDEPFNTTQTLSIDADTGTFNGEIQLPNELPLGNYNIQVNSQFGAFIGAVSFDVLAYRTPDVSVSVEMATDELLRGTPTEAAVQADYFFGAPAADLRVDYEVYAEPYRFAPDLPYSFSDDGPIFFWRTFGPDDPGGFFGRPVLTGNGRTDPDGRLPIQLPADLLAELEDDGGHRVTVEATVQDETNQIISGRASAVFHATETYVGIASDGYVGQAGDPLPFDLITVDWAAEPVPNQDVEVVLYQRTWERDDDGRYGPVDTAVVTETTTTAADGTATVELTAPEGGTYRTVASVTDAGGNEHRAATTMWISGPDASWRPEPQSRRMTLVPDADSYRVGDTAEILVQSPFTGTTAAWVHIERGDLIEEALVTLNGTGDTIRLPITVDYAPNIHVTVIAVDGIDGPGDYGDMRVGIVEIPVDPAPLLLDVTLTPRLPDGGTFQPGDTAVFDVQISDRNGRPTAGTLSLALVDEALLSLTQDNARPIEDAFYSRQPYRSQIGAGLLLSAEGFELELPAVDETQVQAERAMNGMGGGLEMEEAAFAADDAAPAPQAARSAPAEADGQITVRTDFRDTAYWEATVTAGEDGRATVEIPLPDNLTTWQLHAKAANTDTNVGQTSASITVNKPLLLRPITPRFFTVGDVAQVGTVVNNNTDLPLQTAVSLSAAGVVLDVNSGPTAVQTVTVPANDSTTVSWRVVVPHVDASATADLTFTAQSGELSDATKPTFGQGPDQLIPIYKFTGEDVVATSGVLDDELRRVEAVLLPDGLDPEAGELRVTANASLAALILDTLDVIDEEPYDPACAHAVAYQLLPNALTARSVSLLGVDDAALQAKLDTAIPTQIEQIAQAQKGDGGWGWCYAPESHPYFTAYVLLALDKAQEAGYSVPNEALVGGTGYLQNKITDPRRLEDDAREANTQAFYHFVLAELDSGNAGQMAALAAENRPLLDPVGTAWLALALQQTDPQAADLDTLLSDLDSEAIVSATGAHWESAGYSSLYSDIRDTAVVLLAYARIEPDAAFAPQTVKWLTGARMARGGWRTLHDTTWVLLAFTDWLAATDELEADYNYTVSVNNSVVGDGSFTAENLTSTAVITTDLGSLRTDDVNFIDLRRDAENGRLYYNAYLDAFIDADGLPAVDRGITVQRRYYDAACDPQTETCAPLDTAAIGQQVRVELTVIASRNLVFARVDDYFPAGAEAIDPSLATSASGSGGQVTPVNPRYRYGYWGWWYFNRIQYGDDRVTFTADYLPRGTYQYTYTLNPTVPGAYQVRPAFAREEFTPEVNGRSEGEVFTIEP